MTSIAPVARFATPTSPSHLTASVAAQRTTTALWLSLADQADVWAVLDQLSPEKLAAIGSTAYAIDVDRRATAHDDGHCDASCGFCPSCGAGEAL